MALYQYTWLIVVHGIVAWLDAYGIGANDVANAFGTSVGSKTLKLWSAVLIAAIFEFLGAMLLGGVVTRTIAGGIAKPSTFTKFPSVFMFGMLTAETGAMIWILLATYLELPVSTTHSIVGGIIGFALAFGGGSAVTWYERKADFPYVGGIVPIVISWFLSPVAAALVCLILFLIVRTAVLRRTNSTKIAFFVLPVLIIITIWINLFFILTKGVRGIATIEVNTAAWIAAVAAVGCAVVGSALLWPVMRRQLRKYDAAATGAAIPAKTSGVENGPHKFGDVEEDQFQKKIAAKLQPVAVDPNDKSFGAYFRRAKNVVLRGVTHDIHADVQHDADLVNMHADAEKFDPRTEQIFKILQ
eukprot:gene3090-3369_t